MTDGERARADLRAVVEAQELEAEEWWEFNFTDAEVGTLINALHLASAELDRIIQDMETGESWSRARQRYYSQLLLERVELGLLRNRVSKARL